MSRAVPPLPLDEPTIEAAMPTTAELKMLAYAVLDQRCKGPIEAGLHFARFIRDHGDDGKRLAEAIRKIAAARGHDRDLAIADAVAMCKGVGR